MMKLLSTFSGIGAYEKALKNIGVDFELVNYCEIDKYASKAYSLLYDESEWKNLGDITKVDPSKLEDFDIFTWSSPCQDFSLSGNQNGSVWKCNDCNFAYNPLTVHYDKRDKCPNCGSSHLEKTNSSLLIYGLNIMKAKKPKISVYENVPTLTGKFQSTFNMFLKELDEYGYNTYYEVLNGRDYGVPQNRLRVFLVMIRKDIDLGLFKFPKPTGLDIRLKDILENNVSDKYYLAQEKTDRYINALLEKMDTKAGNKVYQLGNCMPGVNRHNPNQGRVYDKNGIAPTLTTSSGGWRQPLIIEEPTICASRGRYKENGEIEQRLEINYSGLSNTLTTVQKDNYLIDAENDKYRIRRLTPLEYFRLMGFSDEDFAKVRSLSDTQLYKMAGNSVCVPVLQEIFKRIFEAVGDEIN